MWFNWLSMLLGNVHPSIKYNEHSVLSQREAKARCIFIFLHALFFMTPSLQHWSMIQQLYSNVIKCNLHYLSMLYVTLNVLHVTLNALYNCQYHRRAPLECQALMKSLGAHRHGRKFFIAIGHNPSLLRCSQNSWQ